MRIEEVIIIIIAVVIMSNFLEKYAFQLLGEKVLAWGSGFEI